MTDLYSNWVPGRERLQIDPIGPSLTQQNFQKECDINNIMRRFNKTGVLSHENPAKPGYGDFTGFDDYHSSMNKILEAQDSFMTVDATIRARFHNDPGEFLEFTTNPDNAEELIKLGLATRTEDAPQRDPPFEVDPTPEKTSNSPEDPPRAD